MPDQRHAMTDERLRGAAAGGSIQQEVESSSTVPVSHGLVVRPFRGLRYVLDRVSGLADVTSPPYDVIDPDDASRLERLDPHNVVRLILPRVAPATGEPRDHSSRYDVAARLLTEWLEDGVLDVDDAAALYLYEQTTSTTSQRGLLAAVGLCAPTERVVLPHEDVMPGPVADRLELMRATRANLEPILLVVDRGGPALAELWGQVTSRDPLVDASTGDGTRQQVWAVTDPSWHTRVADELLPRQALIADGHHRWATYRRLQAELHADGAGPGPWDFGLAMLVTGDNDPLQVAAIHRVVADLDLPDALAAAAVAFTTQPVGQDLGVALDALASAAGAHPYLITDGVTFHLLHSPDDARVQAAMPTGHSARWAALDASVLHALLLEDLWDVADADNRVSYLHDVAGAVRAAVRSRGVAVLMRPTTTAEVMALAAAGERMPRKSTSFGPKPRSGLVMRLLEPPPLTDGAGAVTQRS